MILRVVVSIRSLLSFRQAQRTGVEWPDPEPVEGLDPEFVEGEDPELVEG